ncbi:uncharacterized protein LOC131606588 isoform X2 [Vicia villosa]|uniref:uncharacterized protein LOC131606588 isoform X2 n=1 Tax=Vicia villosa TaxID=3911 RepID=UPI00273AFC03|nr:uncharacterized protein LOC131606588 isoform X2 [Vicia villosa]
MAKVATPSAMPPSSRGISSVPLKGASIAKRKTPSELRGEQLKRDIFVDYTDESPTSAGSSKFKKPGLFKAPRYNDTQLDDVFSAKKPRFIGASGKENVKVNLYFLPIEDVVICSSQMDWLRLTQTHPDLAGLALSRFIEEESDYEEEENAGKPNGIVVDEVIENKDNNEPPMIQVPQQPLPVDLTGT